MKANSYIPALTGVRAIAAFLVFFHHFNQADFIYPIKRTLNEFHIGVTMFFVLSGFLICLRYYETCEINRSWFRKYIKNRIARIYPMYALLTLLTFLIAFIVGAETGVMAGFGSPILLFLLNIFFVRGFFDNLKFTGVGQGWSLTVEESFYFLAPLIFVQIKKHRRNLFFLPLLLMGLGTVLVLIFSNVNFYGFFANFTFMFLYTFFGRCVEFFIGMGLALIILKTGEADRKWPIYTIAGILGIMASVAILACLPLNEREYGLYHPFGIFTNNLVLPIGIALFYFGLIKEPSIVRTFLSTGTMQLLGKSSYIFYLLHMGVIANFTKQWTWAGINKIYAWFNEQGLEWIPEHINDTLLYIAIVFLMLNLISILFYKGIEEPLNLAIRKSGLLETRK